MPARRLVFPAGLLLAFVLAFALPAVCVPAVHAQTPAAETHAKGDIVGDWQGTLEAGKPLRVIVRVTKGDKGLAAKFFSIDQTPQPIPVNTVSLEGSAFKFTVDLANASYTGTLSPDGNTITGAWTQAGTPLPLTLLRATKETAWEIPAAQPPPKMMPADANPGFDVATIKPNDSGGSTMQQLTLNGRSFVVRNGSVNDLLSFAYNVHTRQITGGPDWLDSTRFDINGVPDTEGAPSLVQLRGMVRKLLADRFKLTFHHENRELSAFVLTVGKSGQKLTVDPSKGPLPGFGMSPGPGGLVMSVFNASMADFGGFLQGAVLDRPVVDHSGLADKYDFTVKFTPDDTLFHGHPPKLAAPAEGVEASPSFFEALQQQLGLKLDAQKTAVDVIAIDHVDKPSAN